MSSIYYIKVIAIYPLVDNFENNLTGIIEQNAYDSIFDPTIRNYYDVDSYNSFIDGLNALVDDEFIDYCFADLIKSVKIVLLFFFNYQFKFHTRFNGGKHSAFK